MMKLCTFNIYPMPKKTSEGKKNLWKQIFFKAVICSTYLYLYQNRYLSLTTNIHLHVKKDFFTWKII